MSLELHDTDTFLYIRDDSGAELDFWIGDKNWIFFRGAKIYIFFSTYA
jgi:hypothetical protein